MKRTRKFLSTLLAIVMVIGLLPTATFADEADPAPTATIKVKKEDGKGNPLAGATFEMGISGLGDPLEATSDADGIAVFANVPDGDYQIVESAAPAGYERSGDLKGLRIENGKAYITGEGHDGTEEYNNEDPFVFVNEQYKATFYVTKTDGEAALAGAEFKLENTVAGRDGYTATSAADGKVTFTGVVDGEYILSETAAPSGYNKSDVVMYFKVENGEVKYSSDRNSYVAYGDTLSIVNTEIPTTNIELYKYEQPADNDSNPIALKGAEFALTRDRESTAAYTAVSGDDGKVTFENVVPGDYTLSETKAPAGYEPSNLTYKFRVVGAQNGTADTLLFNPDLVTDGFDGYTRYETAMNFYNEKLPLTPVTITINIPITKIVQKTGTANLKSTTFTFDIEEIAMEDMPAFYAEDEDDFDINDYVVKKSITISAEEGEGPQFFPEAIQIQGTAADFEDLNMKQFKITENGVSGWDCDKAEWIIVFEPAGNDDGYEVYICERIGGTDLPEIEGDIEMPNQPSGPDGIYFINTYTKNSSGGGGSSKPVLNKEDHFAFLTGYPDGSFGPNRNMTRGEVATMFANLLTEKMKPGKVYENTFTDVPADLWCANYIGYVQQFGLISGYEDGSFRPDAPITRAEFATIACRFEELTEGTKTFSDVPETHWAYRFIRYAAHRGWVSGYEDGTFKPDQYITRAEVVTVTCQLLERIPDKNYIAKNIDDLKTFPDVDEDYWAYWFVMEATNGHNYTKKNNVETWVDLKD